MPSKRISIVGSAVAVFGLVVSTSFGVNASVTDSHTNQAVQNVVAQATAINESEVSPVANAIQATTVIDQSNATPYRVTINNVSSDQPLAPGAYVVHSGDVSLNFSGQLSPASYEPLSEIGSNDDFVAFVEGIDGVAEVVRVDAPIPPGESYSFEINVPAGYYLSGLQMPVGTNDALSLLDSAPLNGEDHVIQAANYDNGTEENSPLGSGFEGGQPDPSRGAENIDNGIATDPQENFVRHPQLTETVLEVHIDAYPDTSNGEEMTDTQEPVVEQPAEETGEVLAVRDYTVTINNVSSDQPLAPGIYVVHDDRASLNFSGQLSPASFETLAEIGNPTAAAEFVATLPGVADVIVIDAPILPGESTSFEVSVPDGYLLSGLQMPVGTNDALSLVDSVVLNGNEVTVEARNYDNGTEENSPLGSGFEGGQPDPSRGAENIDNGIATDPQENFVRHPQLTETVLEAVITPHQSSDFACSFVAFDQNNTGYTISDGQVVPVNTNVGLYIDGGEAVEYSWYVDYDGDDIDVVEQREVTTNEWSYTVWNTGQFDYSATVTDASGNTATCDITVHADNVVTAIEN